MWIVRMLLICVALLFFQLILAPSIDLFLVGVILTTFFYHDEQSLALALIGGVLRDFYYPTYGFHVVLYSVIALIGILLIQTIITHRSFWGFVGFSLLLLISASLMSFGYAFGAGATIQQDMLYHSGLFILHLILLSIGYVLIERFQKGMGYGISIEKI